MKKKDCILHVDIVSFNIPSGYLPLRIAVEKLIYTGSDVLYKLYIITTSII